MEKSGGQQRWRGLEILVLAVLLALIGAGAVAAGSHNSAEQATTATGLRTS
ncbi:hypothetical protein [Arthrobacter alpinus]|uniref:hypothetical protein n=1 Tax=Arthrobacter alpinus TaxID=656366 RepID=UPI000B2B1A82|nr:hypothetical protein [Arthrobacter alpinus]